MLFSSPFLVLNNSPRYPAVHSQWPCSAHKLWSANQCQAASADVLSALQPRQHLQSCTQQAAVVLTAKGRNAATTYWVTFARARFSILHSSLGDAPTQKTAHSSGVRAPPNTWFLGLTGVHITNGIWIGSPVLAQLSVVANRHTDHAT